MSTVLSWAFETYFPGGLSGKESACSAGDLGSIPRLGRSPREGKGYALQYSNLENSTDYTIPKSQTQLSNFHTGHKKTSLCPQGG